MFVIRYDCSTAGLAALHDALEQEARGLQQPLALAQLGRSVPLVKVIHAKRCLRQAGLRRALQVAPLATVWLLMDAARHAWRGGSDFWPCIHAALETDGHTPYASLLDAIHRCERRYGLIPLECGGVTENVQDHAHRYVCWLIAHCGIPAAWLDEMARAVTQYGVDEVEHIAPEEVIFLPLTTARMRRIAGRPQLAESLAKGLRELAYLLLNPDAEPTFLCERPKMQALGAVHGGRDHSPMLSVLLWDDGLHARIAPAPSGAQAGRLIVARGEQDVCAFDWSTACGAWLSPPLPHGDTLRLEWSLANGVTKVRVRHMHLPLVADADRGAPVTRITPGQWLRIVCLPDDTVEGCDQVFRISGMNGWPHRLLEVQAGEGPLRIGEYTYHLRPPQAAPQSYRCRGFPLSIRPHSIVVAPGPFQVAATDQGPQAVVWERLLASGEQAELPQDIFGRPMRIEAHDLAWVAPAPVLQLGDRPLHWGGTTRLSPEHIADLQALAAGCELVTQDGQLRLVLEPGAPVNAARLMQIMMRSESVTCWQHFALVHRLEWRKAWRVIWQIPADPLAVMRRLSIQVVERGRWPLQLAWCDATGHVAHIPPEICDGDVWQWHIPETAIAWSLRTDDETFECTCSVGDRSYRVLPKGIGPAALAWDVRTLTTNTLEDACRVLAIRLALDALDHTPDNPELYTVPVWTQNFDDLCSKLTPQVLSAIACLDRHPCAAICATWNQVSGECGIRALSPAVRGLLHAYAWLLEGLPDDPLPDPRNTPHWSDWCAVSRKIHA